MEKGYYIITQYLDGRLSGVAIHNKNGKGLLPKVLDRQSGISKRSQSTIKMEKGYYNRIRLFSCREQKGRNPQ